MNENSTEGFVIPAGTRMLIHGVWCWSLEPVRIESMTGKKPEQRPISDPGVVHIWDNGVHTTRPRQMVAKSE